MWKIKDHTYYLAQKSQGSVNERTQKYTTATPYVLIHTQKGRCKGGAFSGSFKKKKKSLTVTQLFSLSCRIPVMMRTPSRSFSGTLLLLKNTNKTTKVKQSTCYFFMIICIGQIFLLNVNPTFTHSSSGKPVSHETHLSHFDISHIQH